MPSEAYAFEGRELTRCYGHGDGRVVAVDRVNFAIKEREIVSLVGQSGCGKTVLAKLLLRLEVPTGGELYCRGRPIEAERDLRVHWRTVQAVLQDPFSAFNQFFTIRSQLKSAFHLVERPPSHEEQEAAIDRALRAVKIPPEEIAGKYPFELSGGQMQRMLLARIFILRPQILIADEPTSMVDACSRASILDYLLKLREELSMTIVFVTHDIGLAYYVSDRVFVMHRGRLVDQGHPDQVLESPESDITRQLLDDMPAVHRDWLKRSPPAGRAESG
jgi:peptide/nickel transport system ATP-binding protein